MYTHTQRDGQMVDTTGTTRNRLSTNVVLATHAYGQGTLKVRHRAWSYAALTFAGIRPCIVSVPFVVLTCSHDAIKPQYDGQG